MDSATVSGTMVRQPGAILTKARFDDGSHTPACGGGDPRIRWRYNTPISGAALYCGISLLCMTGPAFAQAVPPQATPEAIDRRADDAALAPTNDIIVSARRRAESVQDVPQTVNVVTAQQIEDLNLREFTEIQQIVPGLTMASTSSFSSQATVRGIAFVPEASGNNASVAFYLNDAPISSSLLFQATYDFGQFELQRGPQGTLRGSATPSGSIAYTTRRPDLTRRAAGLNGTLTNTHSRKIDGFINIPIIEDVLAFRVAGVLDENRGNQVRTVKDEGGGELNSLPYDRTRSVRLSVRFEPADWITGNFMYQTLHNESREYGQVVSNSLFDPTAPAAMRLIRPFDRLSIEDQGSFGRQNHNIYVGNIDVRFAGQRLSYVGSYTSQNNSSISQSDNADYFAEPRINLVRREFRDLLGYDPVCQREGQQLGINPTSGSYFGCTNNIARRTSHELRLASDDRLAGIFDYVVGAYYDHNENPARITSEGGAGGSGTPLVNLVTRNVALPGMRSIIREGFSTERSFFGNLTAHLLDDRLEFSGGIRHIKYENQDSLAIGTANNAAARVQSALPLEKRTATVYTASAKFKLTSDIMAYALFGTSWRPGPRVVGNFSFGPTGTGPTPRERAFMILPDETSKSYELGLKTTFMGGRGRVNLAAYYQKFNNYPFRGQGAPFLNYQTATSAPVVGTFNSVAPVAVDVKGIEGELSFNILERWSIAVNASYADGRIKNGTVLCTDLNRDGVPDINPVVPTSAAAFAATLEPGQTVAICSGINRRSTTTPKFSANIQSQFGFDVTDSVAGFLRASATISGSTEGNPESTLDDQSPVVRLNLFAGLRGEDGRWEISAFAKNIFNTQRILSYGAAPLRATINTSSGATFDYTAEYRTITVSPPREFGLSARIAIGGR